MLIMGNQFFFFISITLKFSLNKLIISWTVNPGIDCICVLLPSLFLFLPNPAFLYFITCPLPKEYYAYIFVFCRLFLLPSLQLPPNFLYILRCSISFFLLRHHLFDPLPDVDLCVNTRRTMLCIWDIPVLHFL